MKYPIKKNFKELAKIKLLEAENEL